MLKQLIWLTTGDCPKALTMTSSVALDRVRTALYPHVREAKFQPAARMSYSNSQLLTMFVETSASAFRLTDEIGDPKKQYRHFLSYS